VNSLLGRWVGGGGGREPDAVELDGAADALRHALELGLVARVHLAHHQLLLHLRLVKVDGPLRQRRERPRQRPRLVCTWLSWVEAEGV
jgi:hypothetical protein